MIIVSSDENRIVEIGTSDIWMSLCATIEVRLDYFSDEIPLAIQFLRTEKCEAKDGNASARQFNLIRDELAKFKPDKVVYDINDIDRAAPWANNISDVITSCANFYTTSDGKDLLFEIVSILCYAGIVGVDVAIM